jgi:uncharacterized lipoprotein
VRFADPDTDMSRADRKESFLSKLMFWKKDDEKNKPEQYRIKIVETTPDSVVTVLDPAGNPDHSPARERILTLLLDQLK